MDQSSVMESLQVHTEWLPALYLAPLSDEQQAFMESLKEMQRLLTTFFTRWKLDC